ncbi:hypothetical protein DQP58_16275 [Mycobacterium colombiense]|uniref:Uncharacterized protein n=1 Tax=Mycobacterium colombiense TaxID=339268 RepID=A0A329KD78_9MYCO|nr:hypothetical protein DQP58_16275 [Mycobacterium colombiense]
MGNLSRAFTGHRLWCAVDGLAPPVTAGVGPTGDFKAVAQGTTDQTSFQTSIRRLTQRVEDDCVRAARNVEGGLPVSERTTTEVLIRWLTYVAYKVNEVSWVAGLVSARWTAETVGAEIREIQCLHSLDKRLVEA